MPDRIVRADILTSDHVNALSWQAEVFYRRLFSIVDDFGRYDGRASLLRAHLYPLKLDKVSEADIGKWLTECVNADLVSLYQVSGRPYVEVLRFGQRVRAESSKWPSPADADQNPPSSADSCQQPLSNAPVFVDVFVDVLGGAKPSDGLGRFGEFWASWPKGDRKQDRAKCKEKWAKSGFDSVADLILADVASKCQSRKWLEGYIEAPLVYLNNRRWEDSESDSGGGAPVDARFAGGV